MTVYIQSKSGDYNTVYSAEGIGTLAGVLKFLRSQGSYPAEYRNDKVRVPFEEIEFIRTVKSGD